MLSCDAGFSLKDPLPANPDPVLTHLPDNKWERLSYEWIKADDGVMPRVFCGQSGSYQYYVEFSQSISIGAGAGTVINVNTSYTASVNTGRGVGIIDTLHLVEVPEPARFGCVPTDADGRVTEFLEKTRRSRPGR